MYPQISIIVPIYNSEKYLSICIDSIIKQTFSNFELILIDDGSYDGSSAICDYYEKKDKRIKVIHKINQGVSSARNDALAIAKGDYIGFVDSDDVVLPEMFETMYKEAIEDDVDIVCCGIRKEIRLDYFVDLTFFDKKKIMTRKEFMDNFISLREIKNAIILHSPANKLYKKSILHQKKFLSNIRICEDYIFNLSVFEDMKSISFLPDVNYIYYLRTESSTNSISWDIELLECHFDVIKKTRDFCEKNNVLNHTTGLDKYVADLYFSIILSLVKQKKNQLLNQLRLKMKFSEVFSDVHCERETIILFCVKIHLYLITNLLIKYFKF